MFRDLSYLNYPDPFPVSTVDDWYREAVRENRELLRDWWRLCDDGCPHVDMPLPFDHAYAGVLPYAIEDGLLILEQRGNATAWNPNKLAMFGRELREGEIPSDIAVRWLREQTGIFAYPYELRPLSFYIERRIRVPVLRCIYGLPLDHVPSGVGPGNCPGITMIRPTRIPELRENITMLSSEDIEILFNGWNFGEAA